jgi:uncharacterized protein DUF6599
MRRQFLFVLAFALMSAICWSAQNSQTQLLPDRLGDWNAKSGHFKPTLAIFPEQILKEAGLVDADARAYSNGIAEADVFRFRDPSGAYSVATWGPQLAPKDSLRLPNKSCDACGPLQQIELKSQVGNFLVAVVADPSQQEAAKATLQALVKLVSKQADPTPLPPIRTYLAEGQEAFTERYALGPAAFRAAAASLGRVEAAALVDVAGFDSHAEAMFAKYKAGKDEATLLLIEYPTPQLAEMHLRHLQRGLRDAKLSTSSIERKGSLLSIVLAPTSAEYAEKLRGAVNYETEVTWNEPSTTATDPPITSTLVKIIIATMVLMGMAFVLGIAFGGVRVITKRLFPGKVFDRPAQMEVLQLGLSGKPIDPRDMY